MKQIKNQLNTVCNKKSHLLVVKEFDTEEQTITLSANGNIKQSELKRTITFDLYLPNKKLLISDYKLVSVKPLIMNNSRVLSSNTEQRVLEAEMDSSLISRLYEFLKINIKQ